MMDTETWKGPEQVQELLAAQSYIADLSLATAIFLSARLGKPLLVEGEPGCGKTEIAKVLSAATGGELIRLQCFEGLDSRSALYDWDYPRQLLMIRMHERDTATETLEKQVFSERFLQRGPLLRALGGDAAHRPVLLIDEVDRADEEFEGLLLEVLSDFQITVPEIGTLRATRPPLVVITSNRTRTLSDALKRRCLYAYVDYPDAEKELTILRRRVPSLDAAFARQVVGFVQRLRREPDLAKRPGVAETLDWAAALLTLRIDALDPAAVATTLGFLIKDADDLELLRSRHAALLESPE
jgi:MoxR-like ATPase